VQRGVQTEGERSVKKYSQHSGGMWAVGNTSTGNQARTETCKDFAIVYSVLKIISKSPIFSCLFAPHSTQDSAAVSLSHVVI